MLYNLKYWYRLIYHWILLPHEVKSLSCVQLFATSWTVAYQAPPSMGFSRLEYWSGVPLPWLGTTILPSPPVSSLWFGLPWLSWITLPWCLPWDTTQLVVLLSWRLLSLASLLVPSHLLNCYKLYCLGVVLPPPLWSVSWGDLIQATCQYSQNV